MSETAVEYEMTVDLPNLPKGVLVQIVGLGSFENGNTYEVTAEEARVFRSRHSVGSEQGPTLLQYCKSMHGVEVTTADGSASSNDPDPINDDQDQASDEGQNDYNDGGEG